MIGPNFPPMIYQSSDDWDEANAIAGHTIFVPPGHSAFVFKAEDESL